MFSFLFRKPTNKMYYCNDTTNIQSYIRKIEKDLDKRDLDKKDLDKKDFDKRGFDKNTSISNISSSFILPFVSIVFFIAGYNLKKWIK